MATTMSRTASATRTMNGRERRSWLGRVFLSTSMRESMSQPKAVKLELAHKCYSPRGCERAMPRIVQTRTSQAPVCAARQAPLSLQMLHAASRKESCMRRRLTPPFQDQSDGGNASPLRSNNRPQGIPTKRARRPKPLQGRVATQGTTLQSPTLSITHRKRYLRDRIALRGLGALGVVHWPANSRIRSTCVQAGEALPLQTTRDACE